MRLATVIPNKTSQDKLIAATGSSTGCSLHRFSWMLNLGQRTELAVHADKIKEMYSLEVLASPQARGNLVNLAHPDDEGIRLFESFISVNNGVYG